MKGNLTSFSEFRDNLWVEFRGRDRIIFSNRNVDNIYMLTQVGV